MKHLCFLAVGFLYAIPLFAQESPLLIKNRLDRISSIKAGGSPIEGFDNRMAGVKGNPFLFDDWLRGKVLFDNGEEAEDLQLNFDLHNNLLEVKTKREIKVAKPEQVQSVKIYLPDETKKFIPVLDYSTTDNEKAEGFAEVLYDGTIKLVKKTLVKVHKPSYRPSHDVGNYDYEIRKKEKIYLLEESILKEIKRKPDFGKWTKKVRAYSKQNGLRAWKEEDLILMVQYYDSLL